MATSTSDQSMGATEPPEPGSAADLGLSHDDKPGRAEDEAKAIEEEGEPFDGNFA